MCDYQRVTYRIATQGDWGTGITSVDKKTVLAGVGKKPGKDVDEERKKLIFDTLVQAPFRIPSSANNLDNYVKDLMEGKGSFRAIIDTFRALGARVYHATDEGGIAMTRGSAAST